ncbi:sodium:proton exchanger, partial [Pyxidicoccus sp. 3LG]
RLGYALIAQGGLALCLVAEYSMLVPGGLSQRVLDIVVIGAVANELLAGQAFRQVTQPERSPAQAPDVEVAT